MPSLVDVDTRDLGQSVHVVLEAHGGTLFASTATDADPRGDAQDCMLLYECDSRAAASWDQGITVLAARSEVPSDDGTPGGWIGALVPWTDHAALAVRSWTVDWGERGIGGRDDELVTIALPELTVTPLYRPAGRLRLMGVVDAHAIALLSSRDGTHRVVAVDASGHEVARTETVAPSDEMLSTTAMPPTELGQPYARPVDARTIAFACTPQDEVCTVTFDGTGLVLTHTGATLGPDEVDAAGAIDGLPVDGVLAGAIDAQVPLVQARIGVTLDDTEPETTEQVLARRHAGVVLLEGPEGGATGVSFELLVRGDHVAVSYTRVDDTQAGTTRRDLGLALPPGSVQAERIVLEGTPAYRVGISTTFPIHYSHDCWQGFWVIRAWLEGGGEAFTTSYAEYGYCD